MPGNTLDVIHGCDLHARQYLCDIIHVCVSEFEYRAGGRPAVPEDDLAFASSNNEVIQYGETEQLLLLRKAACGGEVDYYDDRSA
jgi:hypothetical protein